ncbi:SUKH-3 domain-containing protein [Streptomyces sp. NPDC003688]
MSDWSSEVAEVLTASGWMPGRSVNTDAWRARFEPSGLVMHDAAASFLAEFGGLTVSVTGPGISCARTPFELNPDLALGEEDRFLEWGADIGRHLFPLGELDHGRFFLALDESAEILLVETWLASFGPLPAALENLILGVAPRGIDAE